VGAIDRFFGISAANSDLRAELRGGLTTFLTMAYILFVNPSIMGTAIPLPGSTGFAQLLTATALASAVGCLVMGLWARYPFALAPGMGLNAYFAYSVVGQQGVAWQAALGAVFLSGALFLALSVTGARTAIVEAIPRPLRRATSAGIGAFLAFIGLKNAGVVVAHPATLVSLADLGAPGPLLFFGGLILTAALVARGLRSAILVGVVVVTAAAIATTAPVYVGGAAFAGFKDGIVAAPVWPTDLVGALDFAGALDLGLLGIVFIFFFVDLFDTAGTLVGLSEKAGFVDAAGRLPRANRAFTADAVATMAGALVGTSTTTSYIESASGIEAGGRTGLTSVVVAALFLASLFFWPLASAVPAVATAPALVLVGALMMGSLRELEWTDPCVALPAFLTVLGMPLTFSIANGISLGLITWTLLHLATGRRRAVPPLLALLSLALLARYAWLAGG
jgi:adenine/guanine/hypoxanthine permease